MDLNSAEKPAVAMIVFRRPDLTRRVLEAVAEFKPDRLFVIADGPRVNSATDESDTAETRALFDNLPWPCVVTKVFADKNMGLRNRVISGLDVVFQHVDRAIILEDDCLPSQAFFDFSSQLLEHYIADETISLISGNNFAPRRKVLNTYYFSTHANIWGWATWRRTWVNFRQSKTVRELNSDELRQILDAVGSKGQRKSFGKLLGVAENLDSWAIQFAAFNYLLGLKSIVPSQNLVTNVGFGARSTHTKFESWADEIPLGVLEFPLVHPSATEPNSLEMQREGRIKQMKWLTYPIAHPFDAMKRIMRYLKIKSR